MQFDTKSPTFEHRPHWGWLGDQMFTFVDAIPHAVEDGTSNVAFRSAKERCFRGAKGDIGNRERYILHAGEIEELRCSRIRENSGGKPARVRILTNSATTHFWPRGVYDLLFLRSLVFANFCDAARLGVRDSSLPFP